MRNFILLLAAGSLAFAQQYTISTVAGGAPPATPASAAGISIGQPKRVTTDSAGNVYFSSSNSVFKLSTNGTLTLVAGNSRPGFSGDGGPAVNAQLNGPQGVALDSAGDIYIADSQNNRIRIVTRDGVINTFAGSGAVSTGGGPGAYGDGGPAISALLHLPMGVAVDKSGNVYIADTADNIIRKVTTDGNISTIAGDSYPGFRDQSEGQAATTAEVRNPSDVLVDGSGNVYIADTGNSIVRKLTTDGIISTIAGSAGASGSTGDGGPATKAALLAPVALALDSAGNVYIVENGDGRIRKVDTKGNISTFAGTGVAGFAGDGSAATNAQFNSPSGIAIDGSGNFYIADSLNLRVRKIAGNNISTVAGNGTLSYSGDNGPAVNAQVNAPQGVTADSSGNLYIADTGNNAIRKVSKNGTITTFANSQMSVPLGMAVDASGNVYLADSQNSAVRKFSPSGSASTVADNSQLYTPTSVAVDAAGNVYIADFNNNRVRKVTPGGTITTLAGTGSAGYSGDGAPAANAQLNMPQGVAVDANGNVYIADTGNNRVRLVSSGGLISTVAGNGLTGYSGDQGLAVNAQVGNPVAVAVDSAGNLYIADGSARIRKVYGNTFIGTIAGTGIPGYTGDGGLATSAQLNGPSALAVDSAGNVYVADTGNNSVRVLQPTSSGLKINAVANGASNLVGPLSPGQVVVLYGSGMGPSQLMQFKLDGNGLVPTNVAGTSVYFNNAASPVLYTSANQVAAVVPFGISGAKAQVFVSYQGQFLPPVTVDVAPVAPALFTLNASGSGQALAINQGGAINDGGHPADAGTYVTLYATGLGQTTPAAQDGTPTTGTPRANQSVTATIGGKPATVQYAGGAPGIVAGVMQVNVLVPSGLPAGSAAVVLQSGSAPSQPGVTIAVSGK